MDVEKKKNKLKCYGCKNIDLIQRNKGTCPYCKGKGWL